MPALNRPRYVRTGITAKTISNIRPGLHSFIRDVETVDAAMYQIQSARDYNAKTKSKVIDSAMVVIEGVSKDGLPRTSSTGLIGLISSDAFFMKHIDSSIHKLQQSDKVRIRFFRVVFDLLKPEIQKLSEQKATRQQSAAIDLNRAKDLGFSSYAEMQRVTKELNKKTKHGATIAGLKREALRILKEKQKKIERENIKKAKVKAAAQIKKAKEKAKTELKREREREKAHTKAVLKRQKERQKRAMQVLKVKRKK